MASANAAVVAVAREVRRTGGFPLVEPAFLELGHPDLEEAVARLVSHGATRILVVPYFLTLGIHLQRDLPSIAERISKKYNGLEIRIAAPLDTHPALVQILLDRSREALDAWCP